MKIDILTKLKGGDRRSLGNSEELVSEIFDNPALFEDLFVALSDSDPVVRVRASDVMEKVSRTSPHLLQKWKLALLELARLNKDKEVRWHIAQMIPRLRLTPSERDEAVQILMTYLRDSSSIVKTFSMQALADLGRFDEPINGGKIAC